MGSRGKPRRIGQFGEAEYRSGALQRIEESFLVLGQGYFAGSVYLAGRAVEGMLRAVIWLKDSEIRAGRKMLETGHDLRDLLAMVLRLGLTRPGEFDDEFYRQIQFVGRLWFNNMRFASDRLVESRWRAAGEVDSRHTMKQTANIFFETCSSVVKRCETICQKAKSRKS